MPVPSIKSRSDLWQLLPSDGLNYVAEVGVAEGRYSEEMLRWPNVDRVYLVDRWACNPGQVGDGGFPQTWHDKNFEDMRQRVEPFGAKAVILRGDSVEMAVRCVENKSLAMVYIDADHSYEGVMSDTRAWHQKVRPGGIMAFHDYLHPLRSRTYGVRQAVNEFAVWLGVVVNVIPENNAFDASAWLAIPHANTF